MKVISLYEDTSKTYHKLLHKFTLTSINLNFNQPQLQSTSTSINFNFNQPQLNMAVTPKQPNLVFLCIFSYSGKSILKMICIVFFV